LFRPVGWGYVTALEILTMQDQAFSTHSAGPVFISDEDLTRVFNTAVVASQMPGPARDFSTELNSLLHTPAFQIILSAIRTLSREQRISEKQAAEMMVSTFRTLDHAWRDYLIQEGVARLKDPR
jgi:hypothetical protein